MNSHAVTLRWEGKLYVGTIEYLTVQQRLGRETWFVIDNHGNLLLNDVEYVDALEFALAKADAEPAIPYIITISAIEKEES